MQDSSLSSSDGLGARTTSINTNFMNTSLNQPNFAQNGEPIMTNNNSINYEAANTPAVVNKDHIYDNSSEYVVSHILRTNLSELLELAEGVGEFGEFEAHKDNP